MAIAQEFPSAGAGAGINSEVEAQRSKWIVVRNSRILIGVVYFGSIASIFMAGCMALIALNALIPFHGIGWNRVFSAVSWIAAALGMFTFCPWLWKMARKMSHCQARLDGRGVDFNFGTRKAPQELFIPWDQVDSIIRTRSGNNQIYSVTAKDGGRASFSSYTFFRPKKLAKLIAARAGVAIQKG